MAFCRSSLPRGTGMASRYFRLDHDASLATVSPKNSAITTISRKLADANSANTVKLVPLLVARSTSWPELRLLEPLPTLNAISSRNGRTARKPRLIWVRLRRIWRRSSTRIGMVRPAW